ncbi:NADH dehydrogenase 1 alpha subcomplex assembly factor 3 [Lasiosphaeria hispida]|uniref:Mth938 domain-containing protein n=1 Tax=Lasiosphaeria hispida TaxID=260671 RepID=A0AAJ0M7L1_9PEZI|nr:NADH dehydrogenase 1 alpha subcomplex assembly factor 3 [Lasiosphaeria hispida]
MDTAPGTQASNSPLTEATATAKDDTTVPTTTPTTSNPSPLITSLSWGKISIFPTHGLTLNTTKDIKLYPGGARPWDWNETGTRHKPGIQLADVEELLAHGATVVVLSKGMQERLEVAEGVVERLEGRGVKVYVAETKEAVRLYNELVEGGNKVGGLVHSTC